MPKKFTLSLDASQLASYLDCPTKWAYQYKQRIRLAAENTLAMDRGTCVHALLETFYKFQIKNPSNRNGNAAAASELVTKSGLFQELKISDEDRNLILQRFAEYVFRYQFDDFTPARVNNTDGVELGFSKILYETDDVCFILEGKIDLVTKQITEDFCFWDHKVTSMSYYGRKLQLQIYALATGFKYGGYNYVGLQKAVGKRTFRREACQFPSPLMDRLKSNIIKVFYTVKQDILCDQFDENLKSCSGPWDCHPCPYTSLCEAESDLSREAIKNFKYYTAKKWRPWEIIK